MKLSSWHKRQGHSVEWYQPLFSYGLERVYLSKVFSFTTDYEFQVNAKEIIRGGSGYCINLKDGKEQYCKNRDATLPSEVEHSYPDYGLYPSLTKNTAYGFLSRGCPRGCGFCHVAIKEGRRSIKVANIREFWDGQKEIKLLDPNLFACSESIDLMEQLIETRAVIQFTQGIDIRMASPEKIELLNKMRIDRIHMAWDQPDQDLTEDFKRFSKCYRHQDERRRVVYVLTNYNSTIEQDLYRIYALRELKFDPYIMIYNKEHADQQHRDIARWVNNRIIWRVCKRFEDYTRKGEF